MKNKAKSPAILFRRKYTEYMRDFTSLANPFVLLLVSFVSLGMSHEFFIVLVGLVVNETVGSLIKLFFHKKRPNGQKYANSFEKIDAGSFPSIHSSRVAFVYLMLYSATNFISLKILFLALIPLIGYTRVHLKKHYLSDVLGGYVLGVILFLVFNFV